VARRDRLNNHNHQLYFTFYELYKLPYSMNFKTFKKHLPVFTRSLFYVAVVAIIVLLLPREGEFNYQYELNRPWAHGLLTAPFDFEIYKSQTTIDREQSTLLRNYAPYFEIDSAKQAAYFLSLEEYLSANKHLSFFLRQSFNKIYSRGIISAVLFDSLKNQNITKINIISPNRNVESYSLTDIYTPGTAYTQVLKDAPSYLDNADFHLYIGENLTYDSIASGDAKHELLKNYSETSGLVQRGEKIIERGEILTPELYNILNSLKRESDRYNYSATQLAWTLTGEIIIIAIIVLLFFLYLNLFRTELFNSFRHLFFLFLQILLIVAMTAIVTRLSLLHYFIVPFTLLPVIIRVFYDSRTALFAHICTVMMVSFMTDNQFQFVVIQITAGMTAVSSLKDLTQRSQLIQTALYVFITCLLMFLASELIVEKSIENLDYQSILYFALSSVFLLLASNLIYVFEKLFGLVSAITLVELTNVNQDPLLAFSEKAPGSFQHSLQVSNLAAEAARKIGANSLLVRTGALYHDIGKLNNPEFFIENQMGGTNPLMELDSVEAAQRIICHVADGVRIARHYHLPEQIINFIATHHGNNKTKFFYNSFINANPGVKPDDALFSYPGPLPNSKETAILMMADAVEARMRALTKFTAESINNHVEEMVEMQIADGQFRNAPINFRDVELVKQVFKDKLKSIYHTRIEYPSVKVM
jgi:putative nucleotidyltransferase with HDIG domain